MKYNPCKAIGIEKKLAQGKQKYNRLPTAKQMISQKGTAAIDQGIKPGKLYAPIKGIFHHEQGIIHARRRIKGQQERQLPESHKEKGRQKEPPSPAFFTAAGHGQTESDEWR